MAKAKKIKWSIEADYLQACNCDYGCPCEFQAPPTMGFCEGMGAWRINRGRYADVKLDGLGFAFAAHWPGALHEGNGTVQLYFDERAKPIQREALLQIASGAAGGMPFELIVTTFSKVLEPKFVRFKFDLKGRNSSVTVGSDVTAKLEPIKNPVTGDPESCGVHHGTGFIFKTAEVVSAKVCRSSARGVEFSHPNKAGFVTKIKYAH